MKIFVRQPCDGKFFDGATFASNRDKAFQFKSARDAIDLIRYEKWFHAEIVIAYDDKSEFRILGHYFGLPDEIASGLERARAERLKRRGLAVPKRFYHLERL